MTYTLLVRNNLLRKGHYEGVWDSYGAAEERAQEKAETARSFAEYEVWTGSPKSPGKKVGGPFAGKK